MGIFRRRRWVYEPFGETLSEKQVRDATVWQFWPGDTPKWMFEASDYSGGEGLYISMTRPGEHPTDGQLRRRIAEWCELLPNLVDVRRVWLSCHVSQRLFEAACQMPAVESLRVKWGNVVDLAPLTDLVDLRHVHLASLTKVTDLSPLATMSRLVTLEMQNVKRVQAFDALATLSDLELLALDGSVWASQTIDTLEPIGQMSGLRSFSMTNARLRSKSFDPLLTLQNLEGFYSAWWFTDAEFAKLRALPKLTYGNAFEPRPT